MAVLNGVVRANSFLVCYNQALDSIKRLHLHLTLRRPHAHPLLPLSYNMIGRMFHSSVALSDDSILVIGGGVTDLDSWIGMIYQDLWKSEDLGSSWRLVAENTPWAGR